MGLTTFNHTKHKNHFFCIFTSPNKNIGSKYGNVSQSITPEPPTKKRKLNSDNNLYNNMVPSNMYFSSGNNMNYDVIMSDNNMNRNNNMFFVFDFSIFDEFTIFFFFTSTKTKQKLYE